MHSYISMCRLAVRGVLTNREGSSEASVHGPKQSDRSVARRLLRVDIGFRRDPVAEDGTATLLRLPLLLRELGYLLIGDLQLLLLIQVDVRVGDVGRGCSGGKKGAECGAVLPNKVD